MYERFGKRSLDVVVSMMLTGALAPIAMVAAFAIWIDDRGPVLFRQTRVGRDGHSIRIAKLRSMPVNTPEVASATANALPLTRVGRVIRRTNIDELPQLISVIVGDLSLIGPRPALPSQTTLNELRRQNGSSRLRPGLTGLAQINSYDAMPVEEKAAWDGRYAAHVNLRTDLSILIRTFGYLTRRPPIY